MCRDKFLKIFRCFKNKNERSHRLKNSHICYKPKPNITIDEQLFERNLAKYGRTNLTNSD